MTYVLLVDDIETDRYLLKTLLERNGYRVTAVSNGLDALAAARRELPDVIISDVQMPEMDGFTLCHAWMQDAALKAIPFVFYSGSYSRPEDEKFGLALGALRYILKPGGSAALLGELKHVLQERPKEAAPAYSLALDEIHFRSLHESALTRKVDDKTAQLEETNRQLRESEERFRRLTAMSSDFYWETDDQHRITHTTWPSGKPKLPRRLLVSKRRWDIPSIAPDEAGWQAHRAVLDAHEPFRNFEFSRRWDDGNEQHVSISADPVFDASGAFMGYRGIGTDITEQECGRSDRIP